MRKTLAAFLCALLLIGSVLPVLAQEDAIHISCPEDLLELTESCRIDSFSRDLTVILDTDLDLTGLDFSGIPIFCGKFLGNSHTISGFQLEAEGSVQGFFRYLTEQALVQDLFLRGTVSPQGTRSTVGGIVGICAGTVRSCSFRGQVSGSDQIGGIAGTNSGILEQCKAFGTVFGDHFVGGIAGENTGVIRACTNHAEINAQVSQNQVDISHITLGTLSGTEDAITVTDVGGIVGANSGMLRDCSNEAQVGYPHVGYNIGGIAGSSVGYLLSCTNRHPVRGRKEVAGIVGQMEPVSRLQYSDDTLQLLQKELAATSAAADRAARNARDNTNQVNGHIHGLQDQVRTAQSALQQLLPNSSTPPDMDTLIASLNALTGSLGGMHDSVRSIAGSVGQASTDLIADVQNLSAHLNSMSQILHQAPDNLGLELSDISDLDTPEDCTGKVRECRNLGTVQGDLNTGGIVGAMAFENDLDPEDDMQVLGQMSLNARGDVRCVVTDCENLGPVTVKKRCAGGIAGRMALGLVKNCSSTGKVDGAGYVGGIAGTSSGFLRSCSVRCVLNGEWAVGGIAGSADLVTDCCSLVQISGGKEQIGCVLGQPGSSTCQNNVFFTDRPGIGGIDGISYAGSAEPLTRDQFFELPDLSPVFTSASVHFVFEDGTVQTVQVPVGEALEQIPEVPERPGFTGQWQDLEPEQLRQVYFDRTYLLQYTPCRTVLESSRTRPDGRPVLLAQGVFSQDTSFSPEPMTDQPPLFPGETPLECWEVPDLAGTAELRLALPETDSAVRLSVLGESGWRDEAFRTVGSYLVFPVEPGDLGFCLVELPPNYDRLLLPAAGILIAAGLALWLVLHYRKKRRKQRA